MKPSEFSKIARYVCALVATLCLCGGPIAAAGEPDANTPWDPADHLAAYWTTVSLSSSIQNPNKLVIDPCALQPLEYRRSLSIGGDVEVIDSNSLIGLSTTASHVVALDENGREIPVSSSSVPPRWYQAVRSFPSVSRLGGFRPFHWSVSIPRDPNAGYPQLLSRLDWSMYALVATSYEVVDIPFKVTEDWVQVVPGLEILVEQADAQGAEYQYRIQARYDAGKVSFHSGGSMLMWDGDELPERMHIETQILGAEGKPVGSTGGAFGTSGTGHGSDGRMTWTIRGTGSCDDCGQATSFRYRFAVNPSEQEVRFVLEDIPMPTP
jgi:hypothetical protein